MAPDCSSLEIAAPPSVYPYGSVACFVEVRDYLQE
jgi:hypothetical protein